MHWKDHQGRNRSASRGGAGYKDFEVPGVYYPDLLVENSVIVEAVEAIAPIHERQVSTYLRLADVRVGLLLNFGAITMAAGIHRIANNFPDDA